MNRLWMIAWLLSLLMVCFKPSGAQIDTEKICRIDDGRLIFTLNLKWSEKEREQVSSLFDLDSILMVKVYSGETKIAVNGDTWTAVRLQGGRIELSKILDAQESLPIDKTGLFLLMDKWMNFRGNETDGQLVFGTNNFLIPNVFTYQGSVARFYLPGFEDAKNVYISGTFNNWSTTGNPMKFMGKGWFAEVRLTPGKYAYKFIADGKWITDPSNRLKEKGEAGAYNSVVYCPNHIFRLKGYPEAKKVVVTGNFYGWNPQGLAMTRVSDGWELPVWFRDGTYAYKFLADGQWMTDPANPSVKADAAGNLNSFLEIGEPYLFRLKGFADARKVILAGSFNGWDSGELVMKKTGEGWQLPYVVPPGNYEYKFIIDGKWTVDPENPFTTGSGIHLNSFIALKANHLFELQGYPGAGKVIVTGSFNGWNEQDYRMIRQKGKWIFPIYLKPGKYTYKFIVDGKWILDPANRLYEENRYGTGNSVLWKDQPGR